MQPPWDLTLGEVQKLTKDGRWDEDMGDIMLRAVSSAFGVPIVVLQSAENWPKVVVEPAGSAGASVHLPLVLGRSCIRGVEHYYSTKVLDDATAEEPIVATEPEAKIGFSIIHNSHPWTTPVARRILPRDRDHEGTQP
mmetsp:Transcript_11793/g.25189  ORF Transcript_11793/g.25189 Transcript_11793/m.25189 type:complete len:138 (+) Transcript_11793:1593-2006(+)